MASRALSEHDGCAIKRATRTRSLETQAKAWQTIPSQTQPRGPQPGVPANGPRCSDHVMMAVGIS